MVREGFVNAMVVGIKKVQNDICGVSNGWNLEFWRTINVKKYQLHKFSSRFMEKTQDLLLKFIEIQFYA